MSAATTPAQAAAECEKRGEGIAKVADDLAGVPDAVPIQAACIQAAAIFSVAAALNRVAAAFAAKLGGEG